VLLLLVVQLAGTFLSSQEMSGLRGGGAHGLPLALNVLSTVLTGLAMVGNLIALGWFGMWMGLNSKNASIATLKTLAFVQVLPSLGISIASSIIAGLLIFTSGLARGPGSNAVILSFPMAIAGLSALLSLAKDLAFFSLAKNRLFSMFRFVAARQPVVPGPPMAQPSKRVTPLTPQLPPALPKL
jgi:hypothetical protein